ncbi:MAG: hypothetical protein M3217_03260, partial [Actinomycetota bacterium]|nr:hypothetical protein [Actinomycetota bacterium]
MHLVLEDLVPALARLLGYVHRDVGVTQELDWSAALPSVAERDTETGFQEQPMLAHHQRGLQLIEDAVGYPGRVRGISQPLRQDHELITSEPRDGVGRIRRALGQSDSGDGVLAAHSGAQPLGDAQQHFVAHLVSEAVVDRFEVVEVDEQDRESFAAARLAGQRLAEAIEEQPAVGQARKRIRERGVLGCASRRTFSARVSAVRTTMKARPAAAITFAGDPGAVRKPIGKHAHADTAGMSTFAQDEAADGREPARSKAP